MALKYLNTMGLHLVWGGVGVPRTFRGCLKADIKGGAGGGSPPRKMFGFKSHPGNLKPNTGEGLASPQKVFSF